MQIHHKVSIIEAQGTVPNRTLIFEYYCTHYSQRREYYHFQILFFEHMPGIVQYIYYEVSDRGANCTVGVQGMITQECLFVD